MSDDNRREETRVDTEINGSTTVPSPPTTVPPPRREVSETLPLKPQVSYKPGWLCSAAEDMDGLNVIIGFFTLFTLAVTVALVVQIHYGAFEVQVTPHGSVSSDSQFCSLLGVSMLRKGGNAVDAAVASAVCLGVVHPHLTGIGGGGFMLVYDHKRRRVLDVVDFRESAPASLPSTVAPGDGSAFVGVPGFLRGLHTGHATHGLIPWRDLIEPSIQLAREGVEVTESLLSAKEQAGTPGNEAFAQMISQLQAGGTLLQTRLADTLEKIADHGPDALYNGSLSTSFLSTVANQSLMTLDDLSGYKVELRRPLVGTVGEYTVMVPGSPSGGPLLLDVLAVLGTPKENPTWWGDDAQHLQRLAETLRLAALYHAQLGDPDQSQEAVSNATLQMIDPHELATLRKEVEEGGGATWSNWQLPQPVGSAVSVIDNNDLYVVTVSGLNSMFGSKLMSPLGFLLNDALNNFTPHPESSNAAAPDRRPLALSVPAIVLQTDVPCGKRLVVGSPDASLAAQAIANIIFSKQEVNVAVEQPRIALHTRNLSIESWHAPLLNDLIMAHFESAGYKIVNARPPYSSVNVIQKVADTLTAYADSRGGGVPISY